LNPNVNVLGDSTNDKLEQMIEVMISRNIGDYCVQETWYLHDYTVAIRGHAVFHHGMKVKPKKRGRTSAGLIIILGPVLTKAWVRAGKHKPITLGSTSLFPG